MDKNTKALRAGRPSAGAKQVTLADLSNAPAETKRVSFLIDPERHSRLKIYAAKTGRSIKDLLTEHIDTLTTK